MRTEEVHGTVRLAPLVCVARPPVLRMFGKYSLVSPWLDSPASYRAFDVLDGSTFSNLFFFRFSAAMTDCCACKTEDTEGAWAHGVGD